jgi:hypothetical protein
MTSPEYSHTKNVSNELSFPLVTHTTHFGIRFGRCGNLKPCFSSGQIEIQVFGQVFRPQDG